MGDDDIRVTCAKQFATLEATLSSFSSTISDFKKTSDRVTRMEESTKGLWKEIREDIMPELKAIPKEVRQSLDKHRVEITTALDKHAGDCPARIKAMKRAVDHDSGDHINPYAPRGNPTGQVDTRSAAATALEPRRSLLPVSPVVIRWLLYIGLVIGSAIATMVTTLELVAYDDRGTKAAHDRQDQRDEQARRAATTSNP